MIVNGVCVRVAGGEFHRGGGIPAGRHKEPKCVIKYFHPPETFLNLFITPEEEGAGGGRVPSPVSFFD